jgi:hypothetical protein
VKPADQPAIAKDDEIAADRHLGGTGRAGRPSHRHHPMLSQEGQDFLLAEEWKHEAP